MDVNPLLAYQGSSSYDNTVALTNKVDNSYLKAGSMLTAGIGLPGIDFMTVYAAAGYYFLSSSTFDRNGTGSTITTNTYSQSSTSVIPFYAGLKFKLGPGIKAFVGWGYNYAFGTVISGAGAASTNNWSQWCPRTSFYDNGWSRPSYGVKTELNGLYGDNFMDLGFIKFGGDAKFAGSWSLGIAAGVALNDTWTFPWVMSGQNGYTTTSSSGVISYSGANQLLSFVNMCNYDRQMYIKYEDDVVAIKGTISQEGNYDGGSSTYQDRKSVV